MIALFDPSQYKHGPQFSLFSGLPKPNSEVAERVKILNDSLLVGMMSLLFHYTLIL